MADLLKSGVDWLATKLKSHASQSITYSRGAVSVPGGLSATRGKTTYQASDEQGVVMEFESADWIITAADLVIGGVLTTPQSGDRVTHNGQTYQVVPLADDFTRREDAGRCYRPVGNTEALIRIHSMQIAS